MSRWSLVLSPSAGEEFSGQMPVLVDAPEYASSAGGPEPGHRTVGWTEEVVFRDFQDVCGIYIRVVPVVFAISFCFNAN
jgi:hypothetical protein